ncbi:MAG TPA: glycosyltransferase family 9 protein [Noviherbaspirillum sp.]
MGAAHAAVQSEQTRQEAGLLQQMAVRELAVFRVLQLGDMLCAVPALRALRAALPEARITLIGLPWARQFAARFDAYIDDFLAFPGHPALPEQAVRTEECEGFYQSVRERNFDLALQLHGSGTVSNGIVAGFGAKAVAGYQAGVVAAQEATHFLTYDERGHEAVRLLRLVEHLGAPARGTHLEFPLTAQDEDELRASGLAQGLKPNGYFCLHPGARMRDKCWPPKLFAEVGDRVCEEFGLRAVVTGSGAEADLAQELASHMRNKPVLAAAPISIGAMAALMHGARLLISNDTGVSHIADGLQLPSVVVFSKSDMARWAPLDAALHRCVWDPQAQQTEAVLAHARQLLG